MILLDIFHNVAATRMVADDSASGVGVAFLVVIYFAVVIGAIVFMVQNRQSFQVEAPTRQIRPDCLSSSIVTVFSSDFRIPPLNT